MSFMTMRSGLGTGGRVGRSKQVNLTYLFRSKTVIWKSEDHAYTTRSKDSLEDIVAVTTGSYPLEESGKVHRLSTPTQNDIISLETIKMTTIRPGKWDHLQ